MARPGTAIRLLRALTSAAPQPGPLGSIVRGWAGQAGEGTAAPAPAPVQDDVEPPQQQLQQRHPSAELTAADWRNDGEVAERPEGIDDDAAASGDDTAGDERAGAGGARAPWPAPPGWWAEVSDAVAAAPADRVAGLLRARYPDGLAEDASSAGELLFAQLVDACGAQAPRRDAAKARAIGQAYDELGGPPCARLADALMRCHFFADDPAAALAVFQRHAAAGAPPTRMMAELAVRAHARAGRPQQALAIIDAVLERGLLPTAFTFVTALGVCAGPQLYPRAVALFDDFAACAWGRRGEPGSGSEVPPGPTEAGTAGEASEGGLGAFVRDTRERRRGSARYLAAQRGGFFRPQAVMAACSAIITHHAAAGEWERAFGVMSAMRAAGLQPDAAHYHGLFASLAAAGDAAACEAIAAEMSRHHIRLDAACRGALMEAHLAAGDRRGALRSYDISYGARRRKLAEAVAGAQHACPANPAGGPGLGGGSSGGGLGMLTLDVRALPPCSAALAVTIWLHDLQAAARRGELRHVRDAHGQPAAASGQDVRIYVLAPTRGGEGRPEAPSPASAGAARERAVRAALAAQRVPVRNDRAVPGSVLIRARDLVAALRGVDLEAWLDAGRGKEGPAGPAGS